MILGLFLGIVLVIILYLLETLRPATGDTSIVVYFTQTALLIAGPTSKWTRWMGFLALATNITQYGSDCAIKQESILQNLFMPFFTLLLLYALTLLVGLVHSLLGLTLDFFKKTFRITSYFRTIIAITLFSYTDITLASFSSLSCVRVAGTDVLYLFPEISCSSSGYKAALGLQIVILLLFVIGLPTLIFFGMWVFRQQIKSSAFWSECLGGLIEPFREKTIAFQSWVLIRRTAYTAVEVGMSLNERMRGMALGILAMACLGVHSRMRPFLADALNMAEGISLALHLLLSILVSPWNLVYPTGMEAVITILISVPTFGFVAWRVSRMVGCIRRVFGCPLQQAQKQTEQEMGVVQPTQQKTTLSPQPNSMPISVTPGPSPVAASTSTFPAIAAPGYNLERDTAYRFAITNEERPSAEVGTATVAAVPGEVSAVEGEM